uniref:Calcitonin/calcitonin-related protein n=1 Tax=Ornithodoros coriaceus TaxID=92741 RepID=B2D2A6_ORNCO|nr:calcitonin/calcitonin-related protein [Ornithodoros coriaceus]
MKLTWAILLLLGFLAGRAQLAALSPSSGDAELAPREDNAGSRVKRTVCNAATCATGNLAAQLSGGGKSKSPANSTGTEGFGRRK